MLSSRVLESRVQTRDDGTASVHWVLANDGAAEWPSGTTLRLVGGPALVCPIMEIPGVAPGQTVCLELDAALPEEPAEVYYSLVSQACQPFGEIAHVTLPPKLQGAAAPPPPVVAVLASPMDGVDGGLEAMQAEVKTVEWTLANVGQVPWPEDTKVRLFYNTPGFDHLPCEIEVPALEPGMTVHAGVSLLMPEREGLWRAMWAVTSPTHPEFGDILLAEFSVSDFPFMDWMFAEQAEVDATSAVSSKEREAEPQEPFSMQIAVQQHLFQSSAGDVEYPEGTEDETLKSLGLVSGVPAGTPWTLELALTNDGACAWPEDVALTLCFGSGLGCGGVALGGSVQPGETVVIQLDLRAPEAAAQTAWVLASGQACIGPAMVLTVV